MDKDIREISINILQTRMLKCTNQQFWIAGTSTGLNAFVLTQTDKIDVSLNGLPIIFASALVSAIALIFVIRLHTFYYELNEDLVELLGSDESLPQYLRIAEKPWQSINSFLGVVFYSLFVLISFGAVIIGYLD